MEEIVAWRPEVMVLACCGFDEGSGRVHVVDGVRLFSRPGPSLVDSLELLAALLA